MLEDRLEITTLLDSGIKEVFYGDDKTPGVYYIENSVNEYQSCIRGYFKSLKDAKIALEDCSYWFKPSNTGKIYKQQFGLYGTFELILERS